MQETDYLENLGLGARKILSYVSKKEVSHEVMNYFYLYVISGVYREVDEN